MKKFNLYKILLLFVIITLSSCFGNEPPISEKKCIDVIIKIHEADAILAVENLNDKDLKDKDLSYYNYVFKKEKITKEEFLESIEWYTNHPERYKTLYTKVMKKMREADEEKNQVAVKKAENDIWNLSSEYFLPEDGEKNPIAYEIDEVRQGVYTLSADIKYYKDDLTVNPRMTIIAEYSDGTTEQNMTFGFEKDGEKRNYEVKIKTNENKSLVKLKGWVLDHSDDTKTKHIECKNITLLYTKE
ncbi:MAG: DUF4296 domain-containing protein [Bacteroidales bacterium]|nr:DUF4296 domain-containing protein [Bacteroidales bacterium]